jgi:hypothetical protein
MMNTWLLVTIIFIGLAVIVILKKIKAKTAYKHFFKKAIKSHFPDSPDALINEVEGVFANLSKDTRFAAKSSNPVDRRLDFCAYFLALIKVLENKGQSFEQIRSICLEITIDYVSPKNPLQRWLKRLPARLIGLKITNPILNIFSKKVSKKGHPDGFRAVILTDKSETYGLGYGVDILECGICKLFQKHQAGKYASILCEVDKVTSGLAGLELIRTGTIANGAAKCDFRFKKK